MPDTAHIRRRLFLYRIDTSAPAYGSLKEVIITGPRLLAGKTLEEVVSSIEWRQDKAEHFSKHLRDAPQIPHCEASSEITTAKT
ncbi:unnamed protein product [Clavelina lepadiformis]|uniref:Uncharacterized protein n=1 Tax=Clavelina lepadiformis TaxID=159417 RepID=A0ABP0EVT8_CLALP